jgi:hypothetical protein
MNKLILESHLAIDKLNSCFDDKTNSYKFYWLTAILDELNCGHLRIAHTDLALRMISQAWYPLDYYKLSFGKRDSFVKMSKIISSAMTVDQRPGAPSLFEQLSSHSDPFVTAALKKELLELLRWVRYRFIRPFFSEQLKGLGDGYVNAVTRKLANENPGTAPYHFETNHIIIDKVWAQYLVRHQYMLRGFTKYHLLNFLQRNNPNVIGLSEKLEAPLIRKLTSAKAFWLKVMEHTEIKCIYTGASLDKNNLSMDHFIPWSYIAHDQIWNIIPTTRSLNSLKGNALPELESCFEPFCSLQYKALTEHLNHPQTSILEEYRHILKAPDLGQISYESFSEKLFLEISAHHRTAADMGFSKRFSRS